MTLPARIKTLTAALTVAALLAFAPACQPDATESPAAPASTPSPAPTSAAAPTAGSPPPSQPTPTVPATVNATPSLAITPQRPQIANPPIPSSPMTAADFPVPPDRDPFLLARQLLHINADPLTTPPDDWQVGDARSFWSLNYPRMQMERSDFNLVAISDSAYWWLQDGTRISDADIQRTVQEAEARIFPRLRAVFAPTPNPDSPPHRRHIVNGLIPGIGGYVSSADRYPTAISPYSNEADVIYINSNAAHYGEEHFLHILTHEFHHSIQYQADSSEASWLNEGLAELSVHEAGYPTDSILYYLSSPNISLIHWESGFSDNAVYHYGASALFALYLREHYSPHNGLQDLLAINADGIPAVDAFLSARNAKTTHGTPADFHSVFADWMAANLLYADHGPYSYSTLNRTAFITRSHTVGGPPATASLPQYAIDYVQIYKHEDASTIHFSADAVTPLIPASVPETCWWSNRGDSISSTLTLQLTIPHAAPDGSDPTLTYRYWHDIEENWDYLYLATSTDGGATWNVLPASGTTDANPVGNSYGLGYTGNSRGWQQGSASLADYAGQDALLRFHYVTDDAVHTSGFCVQDMRISGASDVNMAEWQPDGFVLINNLVRQDWIVWVIADTPSGPVVPPQRMPLHLDPVSGLYTGSLPIPSISEESRLTIAIAPTAPATMQPADYRVWTQP